MTKRTSIKFKVCTKLSTTLTESFSHWNYTINTKHTLVIKNSRNDP